MAEVAFLAAAGASFYGGKVGAKAQAKQAAFEKQQARAQYLQYKQEGIAVLDEMLRNSAMVNAYAGAGGIDAGSGNPDMIARFNLARGVNDMVTAKQGGQFALQAGVLRSEQQMIAAKATRINAFAQSVGYIAGAAESSGIKLTN